MSLLSYYYCMGSEHINKLQLFCCQHPLINYLDRFQGQASQVSRVPPLPLPVQESLQLQRWLNLWRYSHFGKCFTHVTKTIANLATYSRKLGNYKGSIIFEIDIMKNSSPLKLKFTFFATIKTKIALLFCWTHSILSPASE